MDAKPEKKQSRSRQLATIGGELIVGMGGGLFLGRWADQALGTAPWLMVGGILLGFVLGMWAAYRAALGE